jgi:hypothetical protein
MIHHRQRARKSEANRTGVRVRFGSNVNRTSAKYFGARLELNVHFQTDRRDVSNGGFQILAGLQSHGLQSFSAEPRLALEYATRTRLSALSTQMASLQQFAI